jgi:hypothetical protein
MPTPLLDTISFRDDHHSRQTSRGRTRQQKATLASERLAISAPARYPIYWPTRCRSAFPLTPRVPT